MNDPQKKPGLSWLAVGVISALMLLVLLTVISIPNSRGIRHHPRISCIPNLKMLDDAKATWALENHKSPHAVPTDADLFGNASYIREKPQCPLNGIYTLGSVGQKPRCSIPGHTI